MNEDWKDKIARRFKDRRDKENLFEILLNQIDSKLDTLLNDLARDYHMKASSHSIEVGDDTVWVIQIENEKRDLDLNTAARYYYENGSLEQALISFILDEFKF